MHPRIRLAITIRNRVEKICDEPLPDQRCVNGWEEEAHRAKAVKLYAEAIAALDVRPHGEAGRLTDQVCTLCGEIVCWPNDEPDPHHQPCCPSKGEEHVRNTA